MTRQPINTPTVPMKFWIVSVLGYEASRNVTTNSSTPVVADGEATAQALAIGAFRMEHPNSKIKSVSARDISEEARKFTRGF